MLRSLGVALPLTVLTTLLLVGCGDDDQGEGSPGPSTGGSAGKSGGGAGGVSGGGGKGGAGGASAGAAGATAGSAGGGGSSAGSAGATAGSAGAAGTTAGSAGGAGESAGGAGQGGSAAGSSAGAAAGQAGGAGVAAAGGAAGAAGAAGEAGAAGAAGGPFATCTPNPCANDGVCSGGDALPISCACTTGFSGDRCETNADDCPADACKNGGTCVDGLGAFTCTCLEGYSGATCETVHDLTLCRTAPCQNGGVCTNGVDTYTCACAAGFNGTNCETNIDDCPVPSPCQNGGSCLDGVNAYTCSCPGGFGGDTCAETCGGTISAAKSGNWNDPTTWNGGVVPSPNNTVVVGTGATVTIPAGVTVRQFACAQVLVNGTLRNEGSLTVDGQIKIAGPNHLIQAVLANAGTLVVRGDLISNALLSGLSNIQNEAGASLTAQSGVSINTFSNAGTFELTRAGMACVTTKQCYFSNSGSFTVGAGAFLYPTTTNSTAVNTGTIVNRGKIVSYYAFESTGIIDNQGTIEAVFDLASPCRFKLGAGGKLTNAGKVSLFCPATNDGEIVNTGGFTVESPLWAQLDTNGTFVNAASGKLINANNLNNGGTLTNAGTIINTNGSPNQMGFSNSGTLTSTGKIVSSYAFRNASGGKLGLEAGSLTELSFPTANDGTIDWNSQIVFKQNGKLQNNGALNQLCGGTLVQEGPAGLLGNPPVDMCP